MMLVVSVNKIQITSTLRWSYRMMTHNEDDKAIKPSLKRLTGMAIHFIYEAIGNITPHISTANMITPECVNKHGYRKLSQILDSHGYAMAGNSAGLSYG